MRKIYLSLITALLVISSAKAQLNYKLAAFAGTYTDLVGGTVAPLTRDNYPDTAITIRDEGFSNNLPIGFNFNYNGQNYSTISVNTNGIASFQAFVPITDENTQDYYTPDLTNGPAGPQPTRPILAPLWDDLDLFSPNGITYKTEGMAPNRVMTIQWDQVYWTVTSTSNPTISFQIKLYESSNIVEFVYNQLSGTVTADAAASIGITATATGTGNFLALSNSSASATASSTTDVFNINTKPANGQVYRFSPKAVGVVSKINYHFNAKSGTYADLVGGTTAALTKSNPNIPDSVRNAKDEGYANGLPIGFTFKYNGLEYNNLSANTNGFAALENQVPILDDATYDYYTPDLANGPYAPVNIRPILAPLWDDHDLFSNNGISFKTEGTAPNRVFTVQWDKVYWNVTSTSSPSISFQLKLYETTNVIQFQYKNLSGTVPATAAAEIGISAIDYGSGNYLSLNNTSASPTASYTNETFDLNTKPADGQIYEFAPITTFYSKAAGDLTNVATWGSNPDGSGNAPFNFTDYNQQFNVANRSTVDFTGSAGVMEMGGQLIFGASQTVTLANKLVIKSYPTYTGSIGPIPSSTTITDPTITVERYMTSLNNRAYRLLASTVATTTSIYQNWQEGGTAPASGLGITYGTHITGSQAGANGFDATQTGQPSLFTYDQVSEPQKYDAVTDNTNVRTLNPFIGYLLFVRGDRTPTHITSPTSSSNSIIRASGSMQFGSQTQSTEGNGRFSLVTNPYPSPINWKAIYENGTTNDSVNYENYYTYLDPNVGSRGGYVTVTVNGQRSIPTDPATGVPNGTIEIQSGQAFFVKAKAGVVSPQFIVNESDKSQSANLNVFRSASPLQFGVSLFYNDQLLGRRLADGATALFQQNYTTGIDGDDAEKVTNFDESIGFARANKILSIESRPLIASADTLFLSVAKLKAQQYELQFTPGSFGTALNAFLKDSYKGTLSPISLNAPTVISFTVDANAASSAANRFSVVFGQAATLPVELTDVKAYQKGSGIQVEWSTASENDIDHYEVEKSSTGQMFDKNGSVTSRGNSSTLSNYSLFDAKPVIGSNFYRIRSVSKNGSIAYSNIVKVNMGNGIGDVTIFPNPIKGNMVNLLCNNLIKGKYRVTIVNNGGQQVYSKTLEHDGVTATQKLQLNANVSTGVYQLTIKGEGKTITQQLLIQD